MEEKPIHRDAFEYYFQLMTRNGSKMSLNKIFTIISDKIGVSTRTTWRWYKEFHWQKQYQERIKPIQEALEEKTNQNIVESKADYLNIVHGLLEDYEKSQRMDKFLSLLLMSLIFTVSSRYAS